MKKRRKDNDKQLFLVRNLANVTLTDTRFLQCGVRMIVTHDKKLYSETNKKGEQNCRIQPNLNYVLRTFEEIHRGVGLTGYNFYSTVGRDFERLVNNELEWIRESMFKRSYKEHISKQCLTNYRLNIDFYNDHRLTLNDLRDYII